MDRRAPRATSEPFGSPSGRDPAEPDPLDPEREGDLAVERRPRTRRPRRFKVLLHNDDYTTMEFVVHVLVAHFHKSPPEATHVMLQVHHKGMGVAGVYPKDVAETKVAEVTAEARAEGMPLRLTIEAEGRSPREAGER